MAVLATWKVSDTKFVMGESAYRVYEVTGVANEVEALSACPYQQNSSHPSDGRLRARVPEVTTLAGKTLYRIAVTWFRPKSTSPTGSKLDTRQKLVWITGIAGEQTDIDAKGHPLLNSAGDAFASLPSHNVNTLHLVITRWESTFNPVVAMIYQNYCNEDQFTIFDHRGTSIGTVEPGQILCTGITEEGYDEAENIFRIAYKFELKEEGFDYRIMDQGFHGWWQDGGTRRKGKLCDKKGHLYSTQQLLRGDGTPVLDDVKVLGSDSATDARVPVDAPALGYLLEHWPNSTNVVFLRYPRYPRKSFAGLGL
jgi:hypothetical protein